MPQYLGMYRLTVDGVEHYVVAIRNVFSNHLTTHKKFDLKGSTVDREASDKEKEKDLPTYKDNDFVKEGTKIYIGEEAKVKLIETLTADVDVSISTSAQHLSNQKYIYIKSLIKLIVINSWLRAIEIRLLFVIKEYSSRVNLSIVLDEITLDGLLLVTWFARLRAR